MTQKRIVISTSDTVTRQLEAQEVMTPDDKAFLDRIILLSSGLVIVVSGVFDSRTDEVLHKDNLDPNKTRNLRKWYRAARRITIFIDKIDVGYSIVVSWLESGADTPFQQVTISVYADDRQLDVVWM